MSRRRPELSIAMLTSAVQAIESDPAASTRHWSDVLAATEARLAAGVFPSARWRERAEREREIALSKLARIAAGERVTTSFEEA